MSIMSSNDQEEKENKDSYKPYFLYDCVFMNKDKADFDLILR